MNTVKGLKFCLCGRLAVAVAVGNWVGMYVGRLVGGITGERAGGWLVGERGGHI